MATFTYKARRLDGSAVSGNLPADSRQAALTALDRMGLFPLELTTDAPARRSARMPAAAPAPAAKPAAPASDDALEQLRALLGPRRIGAETAAMLETSEARKRELERAILPAEVGAEADPTTRALVPGVVEGGRVRLHPPAV